MPVFFSIQSTTIEIGVQVSQDATIIFSSTVTGESPNFSLALGTLGNSKVFFYEDFYVRQKLQISSLLNASEIKFFTISWSNDDNLVKVSQGVGNEAVEIANYARTNQFPVNFIGARTM